MKKRLIYSSVLTALLSASSIALAGGPEVMLAPEPDYFSGFYVGGFGSANHDTFKGNSTVDLNEPVVIGYHDRRDFFNIFPITLIQEGNLNTYDFSSGEFDGYGGIDGGWGLTFRHRFYAGIYGLGEWGTSSDTETQTATVPFGPGVTRHVNIRVPEFKDRDHRFAADITTAHTASASNSTTLKITNREEVGGKLGWLATPTTMFYFKTGASFAHISINNSLNVNTSETTTIVRDDDVKKNIARNEVVASSVSLSANGSGSSTKTGWVVGGGIEQFVWERLVTVFAEYTYTNYGSVGTGPNNLNGTAAFSRTFPDDPDDNVSNSGIPISTNVTSQASGNVNVSTGRIGLNFYLGGVFPGL